MVERPLQPLSGIMIIGPLLFDVRCYWKHLQKQQNVRGTYCSRPTEPVDDMWRVVSKESLVKSLPISCR